VSFETAANYDIVTIHTLGTSGKLKPIGWNTKYLSKIDQGDDLPVHQGELLVRTTLSKENALGLLPCKCRGLYLPGQRRMLKVFLVKWIDLPYIRHHIWDDTRFWAPKRSHDCGLGCTITKARNYHFDRYPAFHSWGPIQRLSWTPRPSKTETCILWWGSPSTRLWYFPLRCPPASF